jgi:aspartate/methionine/tyrosine aminotransferase
VAATEETRVRAFGSHYLEWAKLHCAARFSLASSGVRGLPLASLPIHLADLELNGPPGYGHPPLLDAIAEHAGVPPTFVVTAAGCSMANYLALATLVSPGDELVIEQPTYEPLLALASYLGASIRRFERRFENGFRIEPDAVARVVGPRTRAIVVTNLHNPSGVLTDEATLLRLGEIAAGAGARVVVDEVYLDAVAGGARSAIHLGPTFVVTSSLTKIYGLGGLRCGWVLAEPELARRMFRLEDLHANYGAFVAQQFAVVAFAELSSLRAQTHALLGANRVLLDAFLDARTDLECVRPAHGTIVFPRLRTGDVDALCARLRDRFDTSVVPGRFFEMPGHFRIGIGGATADLEEGLKRLAQALD